MSGLQGLYAIILRLADSRNRHIAEKERVRAKAERREALQHKIYAGKVEEVNRAVLSKVDVLAVEVSALREEIHQPRPTLPPPSAALAPQQSEQDVRDVGIGKPCSSFAVAAAENFPIIVESKDRSLTGDEIITAIKRGIDVIGMGVGINAVRKCKNSRVVISLESEVEREAMSSAIQGLDGFMVKEPRARDPYLRVVGVIADLSDARVEEALVQQNATLLRHISQSEVRVKVVRRIKGRNVGLNSVVVQVSPETWKALVDRRVRLGYQMVNTFDQSPLVQCYRCLGFSHRAAECRAAEPRCGHCAGAHDTRECGNRGQAPVCTNCRDRRLQDCMHPAYSTDCPEWRRWDRIARLAVRYC